MNINVRSANDALEWITLFDNVNSVMGDFSEKNAYTSQIKSMTSLIDSESNGPDDPPFGFTIGVRIGLGGKGFNYNVNAAVGLQYGNNNLKAAAFVGGSLYGGSQLGTGSAAKGAFFDLSAGAYLTAGKGTGDPHNFYTLNYNSPSPFKNEFDLSVSYGQSLTYNSAINAVGDGPGMQTQGLFGMRLGNNFSASYNNDATSPPTFAGLFRKALGVENTDAGWTGALTINAFGVEAGYQNFSGYRTMHYPGLGLGGKYPQTSYHQSLNKASTFIQFRGVRAEYFGEAWLQNFIHNNISKESTYHYDFKNHAVTGIIQ